MPSALGDDIYREHVAPVWRYVRARLPSDADADDATSEVFVRALGSWAVTAALPLVLAWGVLRRPSRRHASHPPARAIDVN